MRIRYFSLALALGSLAGCGEAVDVWNVLRMKHQPRFTPYQENDFFADHQANRPLVKGTLAREQVGPSDLAAMAQSKDIPVKITRTLLLRGKERYGIYCAVCHSPAGDGNGIVTQRGFPHPPTYHQDRLRNAPAGYIFSVISNGFGRMYRLGDRVPVPDRWAIVAYVRALQMANNVPADHLSAADRAALDAAVVSAKAPTGKDISEHDAGSHANVTPVPEEEKQ